MPAIMGWEERMLTGTREECGILTPISSHTCNVTIVKMCLPEGPLSSPI